uniref:BHLH domain-containing protein n=1 Tax=Parascaris univalens TaxID=6257 RepID=A0A915BDY4_PARUN
YSMLQYSITIKKEPSSCLVAGTLSYRQLASLIMKPLSEEEQRRLAALREKARMKAMNVAFERLRGKLRVDQSRKIPKVKTLRLAIEYINDLRRALSRSMNGERYDVRKADLSALMQEQQKINAIARNICCHAHHGATGVNADPVIDELKTHALADGPCLTPFVPAWSS